MTPRGPQAPDSFGRCCACYRPGVIRSALVIGTSGLVVGLIGAHLSARVVMAELYGVTPADGITLLGVAAVVMTATCFAAWRPAARAARIDPATLLREE